MEPFGLDDEALERVRERSRTDFIESLNHLPESQRIDDPPAGDGGARVPADRPARDLLGPAHAAAAREPVRGAARGELEDPFDVLRERLILAAGGRPHDDPHRGRSSLAALALLRHRRPRSRPSRSPAATRRSPSRPPRRRPTPPHSRPRPHAAARRHAAAHGTAAPNRRPPSTRRAQQLPGDPADPDAHARVRHRLPARPLRGRRGLVRERHDPHPAGW